MISILFSRVLGTQLASNNKYLDYLELSTHIFPSLVVLVPQQRRFPIFCLLLRWASYCLCVYNSEKITI